jgi:hypothetical protein
MTTGSVIQLLLLSGPHDNVGPELVTSGGIGRSLHHDAFLASVASAAIHRQLQVCADIGCYLFMRLVKITDEERHPIDQFDASSSGERATQSSNSAMVIFPSFCPASVITLLKLQVAFRLGDNMERHAVVLNGCLLFPRACRMTGCVDISASVLSEGGRDALRRGTPCCTPRGAPGPPLPVRRCWGSHQTLGSCWKKYQAGCGVPP